MKRYTKTPSTVEHARGDNKWAYFDGTHSNLKLTPEQATGSDDDEIAVDVSCLLKPSLSTQAVILKVRADIAARGLPLPECIFISAEHHNDASSMKPLVDKIEELTTQFANLGMFAVCNPDGGLYVLHVTHNDEE